MPRHHVLTILGSALLLAAACRPALAQPRFTLDPSGTKVVALSGLTDETDCVPAQMTGRVVSREMAADGRTIRLITFDGDGAGRGVINVDPVPLRADPVTRRWVLVGLDSLLRPGPRLRLGVRGCGAAARTEYVESVALAEAPSPAVAPAPVPADDPEPNGKPVRPPGWYFSAARGEIPPTLFYDACPNCYYEPWQPIVATCPAREAAKLELRVPDRGMASQRLIGQMSTLTMDTGRSRLVLRGVIEETMGGTIMQRPIAVTDALYDQLTGTGVLRITGPTGSDTYKLAGAAGAVAAWRAACQPGSPTPVAPAPRPAAPSASTTILLEGRR